MVESLTTEDHTFGPLQLDKLDPLPIARKIAKAHSNHPEIPTLGITEIIGEVRRLSTGIPTYVDILAEKAVRDLAKLRSRK